MNPKFLRCFGSISSLFRHPLALLSGVLLCIVPGPASAQSVTFVGGQTTVSNSSAGSIAVDSSRNLFGLQGNNVVKISKNATGYGPPIVLPFSGLNGPFLLAVDSEYDVFTIDGNNDFLELPWTGSGYGPQISLPNGFVAPGGLAVDTDGNLFVTDNIESPQYPDFSSGILYEFPKSGTGYGSPITLPYGGYKYGYTSFGGIAADGAGDVFFDEYYEGDPTCESGCANPFGFALELPKTGTGFGPAIQLPVGGFDAVDSAGNLYVSLYTGVAELLNTGTGYGPETALPIGGFCQQLGIDNAGDIFFPTCDGSVVEFQRQSVDFGSLNLCSSGAPAPCSETASLHYNVTAGGTLGTPKVLTGGAPNLDFTLARGSTCTGAVMANSPCSVHVTFRPQAAGVRNGTVEITNSSGAVLATTAISGFGGTPNVRLSTDYLPFGAVPVGSSKTFPVTVTNTSGGTLIVVPSISGSSNYSIASSTCGSGVTSGNGCTLQVQFSPTTVVKHYGLLTLQTGGWNATVGLAGTGSGLSVFGGVNYAPLKFGTVASGSTKVLSLAVTNVGLPGTVTVGTEIAVRTTTYPTTTYTILTTAENTCLAGIAAGQSCTLPVEFAPTSSGTHDDLLTLTPSAGARPSTVWLNGTTP